MNPHPAQPKANVALPQSTGHVSWKPNLAGEHPAPGPAVSQLMVVAQRWGHRPGLAAPGTRQARVCPPLPGPFTALAPASLFRPGSMRRLELGGDQDVAWAVSHPPAGAARVLCYQGSVPGTVLPQGLCICRSRGLERPPCTLPPISAWLFLTSFKTMRGQSARRPPTPTPVQVPTRTHANPCKPT